MGIAAHPPSPETRWLLRLSVVGVDVAVPEIADEHLGRFIAADFWERIAPWPAEQKGAAHFSLRRGRVFRPRGCVFFELCRRRRRAVAKLPRNFLVIRLFETVAYWPRPRRAVRTYSFSFALEGDSRAMPKPPECRSRRPVRRVRRTLLPKLPRGSPWAALLWLLQNDGRARPTHRRRGYCSVQRGG